MPGLDNITIYICTVYVHTYMCMNTHHYTPLAKPGFCSGRRMSCKSNNGALVSTSIDNNDDDKSPNSCALLGTRTTSNNDIKSIGAGMDILALLLAVVQLIVIVTMIATLVLFRIK